MQTFFDVFMGKYEASNKPHEKTPAEIAEERILTLTIDQFFNEFFSMSDAHAQKYVYNYFYHIIEQIHTLRGDLLHENRIGYEVISSARFINLVTNAIRRTGPISFLTRVQLNKFIFELPLWFINGQYLGPDQEVALNSLNMALNYYAILPLKQYALGTDVELRLVNILIGNFNNAPVAMKELLMHMINRHDVFDKYFYKSSPTMDDMYAGANLLQSIFRISNENLEQLIITFMTNNEIPGISPRFPAPADMEMEHIHAFSNMLDGCFLTFLNYMSGDLSMLAAALRKYTQGCVYDKLTGRDLRFSFQDIDSVAYPRVAYVVKHLMEDEHIIVP